MPSTRPTRSANQKSPSSLSNPGEVTVLVFKDNDTSRSFQVSLGWITRLGFAIGSIVVVALLSAFFALKFYRVARKSDPVRVIGLEQRISDLQTSNQGLETRLAAASKGQTTAALPEVVNILPAPTVTVTVTPVAENAPVKATPGNSILFGALPRATRDLSADAAKLPITVSPAQVGFGSNGRALKVGFNIQYSGPAQGSQQGRIIILARGPNTLFAYPEGVLSRAGADSLIVPDQGEYFSVSRFREVKADFPDLRGAGNGQIQDVEILIVSLENQLLFYQKIPALRAPVAPKTVAAPKAIVAPKPPVATPVAPKVAEPPSDSSELIEPGVDQ